MEVFNRKKLSILFSGLLLIAVSCGPSSSTKDKEETAETEEPKGLVEQEIDYQGDSITMKGFMVHDTRIEGKRPAVLVVHEWWGHNDYARQRARMLAELGYVALAVDMYGDGKLADHPEDAMAFMTEAISNIDGAKDRFEAAMRVIKSNEVVDQDKVAAIGYCFGGAVVLHMARMGLDLDGVVSFHGNLATEMPAQPGQVTSKVLVCHGADDPFVPEDQVTAFKAEMESAGVDYEFVAYEGAVHSFTSKEADENAAKFDMPLAYNAEADEQSWAKMQEFFNAIFGD